MEGTGCKKMLPFLSSSSSSSSSFCSNYKGPKGYEKHQRLWLGTRIESEEEAARSYVGRTALEFHGQEVVTNFNRKLELTDLSLRNNDDEAADGAGKSCGGSGDGGRSIEREHMFDKVVTPSDVGKLNRLVIPKQYAEKYFPLDSSANEKGFLLNFEDRNGKPWRFRYSYWNSSQSYVMTKGWSRFVKDKKLDAGDIVSFERGVGESGKDRLYIDWRRRPDASNQPTSLRSPPQLPNLQQPFNSQSSVRWGRLYSSISMPMPWDHEHLQQMNYDNNIHPYQRISYDSNSTHDYNSVVNSGSGGSHYYLSSSAALRQIGTVQQGGGNVPMVIDSVPVIQAETAAKRLRLFGVNMECPRIPDDPECDILSSTTIPHVTMSPLSPYSPSSSHSPLQLKLYNGTPLPTMPFEVQRKGKASLSFDLDL
ncbi:hypothetical protein L1049_013394 [Liquidambar formosana]|uniref:TF-B3 domain-containing protein n=1 Tax=Liquidambar formosana TaxID=63359 RepID=A0AAP0WY30_LIQFO